MTRPNLLVTRKLPGAVETRLRRDYKADLNEQDRLYDRDALLHAAGGKDALLATVTDRLDKTTIEALPGSIKVIATFSVGYDHIDIAAAHACGLVVTNTPDVLTDATADIALLLLLGAARGAGTGEAVIRTATWAQWAPTAMLGIGLTAKRLGILGMGRIGRAVAKRAAACDMTIHYHNRHRLSADREAGARYHATLESLLAVSDFLSVHCASTPQTKALINRHSLNLLPHGAVLVNTARGDIIDDDALIDALRSGQVAAAGLDVFNGEPDIDPRYRTQPNTFLLPHLGSATLETRTAMGMRAADNLDAYFAGETPPDVIPT